MNAFTIAIERAGGVANLCRKLSEAQEAGPVTPQILLGWRRRNQVPEGRVWQFVEATGIPARGKSVPTFTTAPMFIGLASFVSVASTFAPLKRKRLDHEFRGHHQSGEYQDWRRQIEVRLALACLPP